MISALMIMTKSGDYFHRDDIPLCLHILKEEYYLSYLPLAHIYEHLVALVLMATSSRVGFSQGDPKKLLDDVAVLRPTVFAAVPRVLQRIYDRVTGQVQQSGFIKKSLFSIAFETKLH